MKLRVKTHRRPRQDRAQAGPPWVAVGTLAAYAVLGRGAIAGAHPREVRVHLEEGASEQGQQPVLRFDVPAGTLPDALAAFQAVAGLQVLLPPGDAARSLGSAGLRGDFTARQALQRLLEGTGLTARWTGADAVTLELRTHETVTVTGSAVEASSPKYTEPLRDVPQTITVIPSAVIEAQGASTLRDVLRNVTGISIQAGEGGVPAGDNLSVRGFNARTDMFIDGVRDTGAYSRDPFNVDQVEVTKGPASAYTGRGSTGGSVNLSTKAPGVQALREATVGLGSTAYKRGTLDVNQPLPQLGVPGAAFRLNAMWTDADTPGRDEVTSQRWGLAPSLAFGLGTRTRAVLSYFRLDQDNLPEYGLPWVPANHETLFAYRDQAPPVSFDLFYGLNARDYEDTATNVATARLEHDFRDGLQLRGQARYGRTDRDSVITAPRFVNTTSTLINRQLQSRDQADDILAGQVDLSARFKTGGVGHALVAGLELDRETSENFLRAGPLAPTTDLFAPDPADPYPGPIVRTGAVNDGAADTLAGYAFDTATVHPKLELSAGARWERFAVDYNSRAVTGEVTHLERTDRMLGWRAGAVWKPRPQGSVYAGLGDSFNPSAEGLSLSASTAALPPEKSRSYELGTKWDLLGARLAVTGAVFRTIKTNARTPGLNPGDPPTVLEGRLHVDGLELGATGRVGSRGEVFGAYTFMDSVVEESNTPAEVGNAFGNTPRHSFRLWSTWRLPRSLEVGGGVEYVGERFNNNTGTRLAPGYWVLDATAACPLGQHVLLRLNALNLADERYIDRLAGGHFIPGAGRSVSLTAGLKF